MPEVAYNQSLRGENYYGFGIIQQTPFNDLDSVPELTMTRGGNPCMKEEILYQPHEKVMRNAPNNFKKIVEEPSMKMNYEDRQEQDLDRGVMFAEMAENQNLDFDGDGDLDMDFIGRMVNNEKANDAVELMDALPEVAEELQGGAVGQQEIQEKSVKSAEPETVIKESHKKIVNEKAPAVELAGEQEVPKPYEKPRNELKSVSAKRSEKDKFKMSDGVVAGAGAMALALMILGRV